MLRKLLLVFCLVCGCLQVAAQGKLSNVKVEDADGKLVEISSLVDGKPFIMSFWGITCKPCLMELNAINDQLEEWQEEVDFEVVAVSIDDSRFLLVHALWLRVLDGTLFAYSIKTRI